MTALANAQIGWANVQVNRSNANTNRMNAYTNEYNAKSNRMQALVAQQNAETNWFNSQVNYANSQVERDLNKARTFKTYLEGDKILFDMLTHFVPKVETETITEVTKFKGNKGGTSWHVSK
jgi:uncharacterized cysteine cluster protein YcgN (CxxCxxCC family)